MISSYPHTRFVEWFFSSFAYKKKPYHPSRDGYTDADIEFFTRLHDRYLELGFSENTARKEMYMMAKDDRPRVLPTKESIRGHSNRLMVGKQMVLDLHPNLLNKDGDLDLEHLRRLTQHVQPVCVHLRAGGQVIHQVDLTWPKQHKPKIVTFKVDDKRKFNGRYRLRPTGAMASPEQLQEALADAEYMKNGKINIAGTLAKHSLGVVNYGPITEMYRASNPGV